ncbi:fimbria/pilus periplasmic chaperone [Serratia symbiotica]|nr:fimbria/pilus periplasmic chaperone [Serratia symbiotica]
MAYSLTPNTKEFTLKLGTSRVIYHANSSGAMLSVINEQDYPILVQGKVYAEDKKSTPPFYCHSSSVPAGGRTAEPYAHHPYWRRGCS